MRICSPQIRLEAGSTLGGVVYDRELLRALGECGNEIEIPIMMMPDYSAPKGLSFHPIGFTKSFRGATILLQGLFFQQMVRLHLKHPFDLVRVFNNRYVGLPALLFRLVTGVPTVVHYNHLENDGGLDDLLDRLLAPRYNNIVTLSRFTQSQICTKYKLAEQRVSVSYCGVSSNYLPIPPDENLVKQYGLDGKLVLLTLSVIRRRKNIECLIDAVARLRNTYSEIVLVICGERYDREPDYYDVLSERVSHLGIQEFVRFVGYVPEDKKPAFYNLADIFVFSSRLEGFGLAPVEAMACGKPVVASNAGSLPEIIREGENGFLADPNNSDEFAAAIAQMIELGKDGRRAMGQAAQEWSRQFTWSTTANRVLAAYESVLTRRSV